MISSDNNRIAKNTLLLFIRMLFVLIINLYTSRVILQSLGVTDYGVYNVVAGFVSMFGFLNATLSSSMQRYYNFEYGRSGEEGVQRVYVTGFRVHVVFAIALVVLLESFGIWYVNRIMVIPPERLFAANVLFQVSVLSLIILVIQIPYLGIILAKERMGVYAAVSVLDVLLRLGIALIIRIVADDRLIVYSYLLALVSVIDFAFYFVFAKKKFKEIKLKGKVDKGLLQSLLSFSGWNLVGTFSFMLKGQGLNLLLNFFFGPVVNAARGLAFQVSNAVSGFSNNITTAFRPQIVNSYASHDRARSIRLTFIESKVCFVLIAALLIPLCLEIKLVLSVWLGESNIPPHTGVFTCLALVDCLIAALNAPSTHLVFADGNIKAFQIGSSIVHLLLIPASYVLLKLGLSASSVFVITIVFSIINQTVCVVLGDRIVQFGIHNYMKEVVFPCVVFIILQPILPYLFTRVMPDGFVRLIVLVLIDVLISVGLGILLMLNKEERKYCMDYIREYIPRFLRKDKRSERLS